MQQERRVWWSRPMCAGGLLLLFGILFFSGLSVAIEATNTEKFCISCHTMRGNYEEYKESLHYKNPSGVRATCPDCHVPRAFGDKMVAKILAAKDVWYEITGSIDTPEKFEAHRWTMANHIWDNMRKNDSRECRVCHSIAGMDLEEQSKSAARKHAKTDTSGKTCIDCHRGIVHKEPDPPAGTVLPEEPADEEA